MRTLITLCKHPTSFHCALSSRRHLHVFCSHDRQDYCTPDNAPAARLPAISPSLGMTKSANLTRPHTGHDNLRNPRYSQVGGYYGNQPNIRESIVENSYGGPPVAGPSKSRFSQRLQGEPLANGHSNRQAVYPVHGHQQSRDTFNTGESSGSQSEPWGNSTDPSSENSSIDKVTSMTRVMDPADPYVYNNYGGPVNPPGQVGPNGYYPPPMNAAPPAVPANGTSPTRSAPIKLGGAGFHHPLNSTSGNATLVKPRVDSATPDKRKSWFKRRFSKD